MNVFKLFKKKPKEEPNNVSVNSLDKEYIVKQRTEMEKIWKERVSKIEEEMKK